MTQSTKSIELELKKSENRKGRRGKKQSVSQTYPVARMSKPHDSHLKVVITKRRARKPTKSSRKHNWAVRRARSSFNHWHQSRVHRSIRKRTLLKFKGKERIKYDNRKYRRQIRLKFHHLKVSRPPSHGLHLTMVKMTTTLTISRKTTSFKWLNRKCLGKRRSGQKCPFQQIFKIRRQMTRPSRGREPLETPTHSCERSRSETSKEM